MKKYPKYTNITEHNVAEFFQLFIQFTFPLNSNKTFENIFYSSIKATNECIKCRSILKTTSIKHLFYIEIGLPENESEELHLRNAIYNYFDKKFIQNESRMKCNQCANKKENTERIIVNDAEFLFVLISRYELKMRDGSSDSKENKKEILRRNNPVEIHFYLEESYMGNKYEIHSIICETENKHYYSLIKHPKTDEWILFDGLIVKKVNLPDTDVRNLLFC